MDRTGTETWSPLTTKPSLPELKTEVLGRASSTGIDEPRCVNWTGTQLILWLATHAPDTVDEADDKAEMERLSPTSAAAESPEDTAGQVRWKKNSMLILLVNCLARRSARRQTVRGGRPTAGPRAAACRGVGRRPARGGRPARAPHHSRDHRRARAAAGRDVGAGQRAATGQPFFRITRAATGALAWPPAGALGAGRRGASGPPPVRTRGRRPNAGARARPPTGALGAGQRAAAGPTSARARRPA